MQILRGKRKLIQKWHTILNARVFTFSAGKWKENSVSDLSNLRHLTWLFLFQVMQCGHGKFCRELVSSFPVRAFLLSIPWVNKLVIIHHLLVLRCADKDPAKLRRYALPYNHGNERPSIRNKWLESSSMEENNWKMYLPDGSWFIKCSLGSQSVPSIVKWIYKDGIFPYPFRVL